MENHLLSMNWFPDYPNNAVPQLLLDQRYDDFDAQAERLIGHDQQYFQTSSGAFQGRFASVFLGPDVSIHIERANQALEQRLACPPGHVLIGLVLSRDTPFVVNGQPFDCDSVLVSTPGSDMIMTSPPDATVLALSVASEWLTHDTVGLVAGGGLGALFAPVCPTTKVLDAPQLAARLRADLFTVLDAIAVPDAGQGMHALAANLGAALVHAVCAQMSLQIMSSGVQRVPAPMGARDLVARAKAMILADTQCLIDNSALSDRLGLSARSVQTAFSRCDQASPAQFIRTLRLNRVRQQLLHGADTMASIGDLAASCGFWNWSRFSTQYKAQFGELPSQTRARSHHRFS